MKNILLFILAVVFISSLDSCSSMKSDSQKYFRSQISEDFKQRVLTKIGVYVYSEKGTKDKFIEAGVKTNAEGKVLAGYPYWTVLRESDFVKEVTLESKFDPDTSNSGPSTELANQISKELRLKGFKPKVFEDLGHNRPVKVTQIVEHAKSNGMDAVFVVHYTSLSSFTIKPQNKKSYELFGGIFRGDRSNTTFKGYSGFLYLPNAIIYDLKGKEIVWSVSNYGLIQKSHTFSHSVKYQDVIPDVLVEYLEDSYLKAAVKAKEMIFEPKLWPDSYHKIPDLKVRKRKL